MNNVDAKPVPSFQQLYYKEELGICQNSAPYGAPVSSSTPAVTLAPLAPIATRAAHASSADINSQSSYITASEARTDFSLFSPNTWTNGFSRFFGMAPTSPAAPTGQSCAVPANDLVVASNSTEALPTNLNGF